MTLGKLPGGFAGQVKARCARITWPGNVRELRNVIERAVVLSSTDVITAESLPRQMLGSAAGEQAGADNKIEQMERTMLLDVMRRNGGNVSSAARELGISRDTLRYRIRKYGIDVG